MRCVLPERVRARRRVRTAVANGTLPPAIAMACVDCGTPAAEYDHHLGYQAEHALAVQPVCRPCHSKRGAARGEVARGDRNGQRKYPERTVRGDRHYARHSPERLARGSAHGCAKLDESTVVRIRARVAAGESKAAIARDLGLTRTNVSAIALRQIWRHVP
jgi:hypothetical protein